MCRLLDLYIELEYSWSVENLYVFGTINVHYRTNGYGLVISL